MWLSLYRKIPLWFPLYREIPMWFSLYREIPMWLSLYRGIPMWFCLCDFAYVILLMWFWPRNIINFLFHQPNPASRHRRPGGGVGGGPLPRLQISTALCIHTLGPQNKSKKQLPYVSWCFHDLDFIKNTPGWAPERGGPVQKAFWFEGSG